MEPTTEVTESVQSEPVVTQAVDTEAKPEQSTGQTEEPKPTSLDIISKHLAQKSDKPTDVVQSAENDSKPEMEPETDPDGESKPDQEDKPKRSEARINELTSQLSEKDQMIQQFQDLIVNNEVMMAEYQRLQNGGQPVQQQQQVNQQTQQQQHQSMQVLSEADLPELDQWSDTFVDDASKHMQYVAQQTAMNMFNQLAAPIYEALNQMAPSVHQFQQSQLQNLNTQLMDAVYKEMPTAKTNKVHEGLLQEQIARELQAPEFQQGRKTFEEVAKNAAGTVKEMLKEAGVHGELLVNKGAISKLHTEQPSNFLKNPQKEPKNALEAISNHMKVRSQ